MTHYTATDFVDPADPPPHLLAVQSAKTVSASRNDSESQAAVLMETVAKKASLPRMEIPQSALRSNPQISTITSIPSDMTIEKHSTTTMGTFRNKENVTVRMPKPLIPSL